MSRTFRHRLASSHFITYLTVFTFEGKSSWVPIHLKDILHASQGQVSDMNHFGVSDATFTETAFVSQPAILRAPDFRRAHLFTLEIVAAE